MMHWSVQTWVAVILCTITVLGILWRGFRYLVKQNNEQLAEARRIKREVFGEDPDDPEGPKGPSIRVLIGQVIEQTRPLVSTVEEHGRRLGKAETELIDHAGRISAIEKVILRNMGGSGTLE